MSPAACAELALSKSTWWEGCYSPIIRDHLLVQNVTCSFGSCITSIYCGNWLWQGLLHQPLHMVIEKRIIPCDYITISIKGQDWKHCKIIPWIAVLRGGWYLFGTRLGTSQTMLLWSEAANKRTANAQPYINTCKYWCVVIFSVVVGLPSSRNGGKKKNSVETAVKHNRKKTFDHKVFW